MSTERVVWGARSSREGCCKAKQQGRGWARERQWGHCVYLDALGEGEGGKGCVGRELFSERAAMSGGTVRGFVLPCDPRNVMLVGRGALAGQPAACSHHHQNQDTPKQNRAGQHVPTVQRVGTPRMLVLSSIAYTTSQGAAQLHAQTALHSPQPQPTAHHAEFPSRDPLPAERCLVLPCLFTAS